VVIYGVALIKGDGDKGKPVAPYGSIGVIYGAVGAAYLPAYLDLPEPIF
jgi:hypothetical protein